MGNTIGSNTGGMGNFFDVDTIADKLSQFQQRRIKILERKEEIQKTHLSLYNNLQTYLSDNLQKNLHFLNNAFNGLSYQVTTSNQSIVTANIIGNKDLYPTTHVITVGTLAQAESVASVVQFTDANGALNIDETLTFSIGASSFSVAVGATDTLENIRDNINANSSNIGVTASILSTTATDGSAQYCLIISSNQTGTANQVTISGDTSNQFNFSNVMTAAQDATFTFDNLNVVRSSNYVNDVIDGLAFNLVATTPTNSSVSITVNSSTQERNAKIMEAFENVISTYNKLIEFIDQSQADRGSRDDMFPLIKATLENAADTPYSGSSTLNTLLQIGIFLAKTKTMNSTDGTVYKTSGEFFIDNTKLIENLNTNFSAIKQMITDPNSGYIKNLTTTIEQLSSSSGPIVGRKTEINQEVRFLEDKVTAEQIHLDTIQKDIRAKYTVANNIIRQLEQTGAFLELQLSNMNEKKHK